MIPRKGLFFAAVLFVFWAQPALAQPDGVAIQRIITNTRAELGQLANSSKAIDISEIMEKFDRQYDMWSHSCADNHFDPEQVDDACRTMADQMRETGIELYGKLAEYLPDVAARYKQGARSASRIAEAKATGQSPAELYEQTRQSVPTGKNPMAGSGSGVPGAPFPVAADDFPDQTEELFSALEKLVPDFGHEQPEAVRAGNIQINMSQKANRAQRMASQFKRARFALEAQRDYGQIIMSTTKAIEAIPKVLGIQYTGTRLSAQPNRNVLDYYKQKQPGDAGGSQENVRGGDGFDKRL